MVATFLVSVAALIIAILGCAWVKPAGSSEDVYDAADEDWTQGEITADHTVWPQEH